MLIDLKIGKLTHQDVGQMDSYIRMFDDLYKNEDDNPTIGLILCSQKERGDSALFCVERRKTDFRIEIQAYAAISRRTSERNRERKKTHRNRIVNSPPVFRFVSGMEYQSVFKS